MPHALERLAVEPAQRQALFGQVPRFAAVFAGMNMRPEPRAVHRRVVPLRLVRVLHHVIHFQSAEMRTLQLSLLPVLAPRPRRAFARPDPHRHRRAHARYITRLAPLCTPRLY